MRLPNRAHASRSVAMVIKRKPWMLTMSTSTRSNGDIGVPPCINWSVEEVAAWVEELGFREYTECFRSNAVAGNRLIWVDSSTLPRMGITDWKHIQFISGKVRELLTVERPYWNKSITLPHRCEMGMFLEKKSFSGLKSQKLKFAQ